MDRRMFIAMVDSFNVVLDKAAGLNDSLALAGVSKEVHEKVEHLQEALLIAIQVVYAAQKQHATRQTAQQLVQATH